MSRALVLGLVGLIAVGCGPETVHRQDWQTVTSSRQRAGEESLDVRIQYGAGRLMVAPAESGGELYRATIRYDAGLFRPVTDYEAGSLEVGLEGSDTAMSLKDTEGGDMDIRLTPDVPLELAMDFGAAEAEIELGGLRVESIDFQTGASDTELRFSNANPGECTSMELSLGAAAFRAEGLGNANCRAVRVDGGVGDVSLDFGGEWRGHTDVDVRMALGSLTLVIPEGVGVRIEKDTFLTGLDAEGLVERGGVHYSSDWDSAEYRLTVDLSGAFGNVNIRWRDQ